MKQVLLTAWCLACVGCASQPPVTEVAQASVSCSKESPMGSNRLVTKCRTAQQTAQEKADGEVAVDLVTRGSQGAPGAKER